jgi:hypothetical protein
MEHLPAPSAYLTTIQHRFLILLSAACVFVSPYAHYSRPAFKEGSKIVKKALKKVRGVDFQVITIYQSHVACLPPMADALAF